MIEPGLVFADIPSTRIVCHIVGVDVPRALFPPADDDFCLGPLLVALFGLGIFAPL